MFGHTRSDENEGMCDCAEYFFYYPKSINEVCDDFYDWARVGLVISKK